jgi:hypothetical protein
MKMTLIAAAILGGCLILAFMAAAFLVPPTREGKARIVVKASPARIVAVLADVESQQNWRQDVVDVTIGQDGWTETTARGEKIDFRWKVLTPARAELTFSSWAGYTGVWIAEFQPTSQGIEIVGPRKSDNSEPFNALDRTDIF